MLPQYYALRGWNAQGVPLPTTLNRLGLHELHPHAA
jgi:aldehyde:ferredoxin oxidoreductase